MTYHRHNAALQQAGSGVINGDRGVRRRACRARRQQRFAVRRAAVLVLRDEPRGAQSGARLGRRHAAVLQEPGQSALLHHLRQIGRRGGRIVRALDAPLRPAGMAHHLDAGRRRARAGAASRRCGSGRSASSCISSACSSISRAGRSRGCSSSRRCRAISPRCCAARSKRSCPITTSTSPIGSMRAWCRWRKAVSISTIISTT